ncbi:putative toxin-antitoxin system toxin component, PIN family [Pyrococcus kukulkanii]|nr:putative toxin-antitoxin system toxin component, PIN family [Pyrococcus kukulkanii]
MKRRIRVVLDTSILISALKSADTRRSPAWRILKALQRGDIINFASEEIIEEMQVKILSIGLRIGATRRALRILTIVLKNTIVTRPKRRFSTNPRFLEKLKDPEDAKFFDVAYTKKVDYIISEDVKHIIQMRDEKTKTYSFNGRKVKILRAREFIEELSLK